MKEVSTTQPTEKATNRIGEAPAIIPPTTTQKLPTPTPPNDELSRETPPVLPRSTSTTASRGPSAVVQHPTDEAEHDAAQAAERHRRGRTGALRVKSDDEVKRELGIPGRKLHKGWAEQASTYRSLLAKHAGSAE